MSVPPGGSTAATVTARPGRQTFRGATVTRPFEVLVQPDGPGRPGRAESVVELAPSGWIGRVALVLLVLAVAGVGLGALLGGDGGTAVDEPDVSAAVPPPDPDCPGRDHLSPDANGIVRQGVRQAFDYTFLFTAAGGCQPVRFNPCQPVRYALNRGRATEAHVADLLEGLRKLSVVTGLEFERVADTIEDPRQIPRARRQPDGPSPGPRWSSAGPTSAPATASAAGTTNGPIPTWWWVGAGGLRSSTR